MLRRHVFACILLLYVVAAKQATLDYRALKTDPLAVPLPATSAALSSWWSDETAVAIALVERILLDTVALLATPSGAAIRSHLHHCSVLTSAGQTECACACAKMSTMDGLICSLCRRLRLRVRSTSSSWISLPPIARQSSTIVAFDEALSKIYSSSAAATLDVEPSPPAHCPALIDSLQHLLRTQQALQEPQQLPTLFPYQPTNSNATQSPAAATSRSWSSAFLDPAQQLDHLSRLISAIPTLAHYGSAGGGGGGGLGYQVRCAAPRGRMGGAEFDTLWSMGGGGGGGYRTTASEQSAERSSSVRWQGGAGSGAGLHWDGFSIGGGAGGGLHFSALLSPPSASRLLSLNTSHGARPDAADSVPPSTIALADLSRALSSRMHRCLRRGHALRISGGGGAGGGYQARMRLQEAREQERPGHVDLTAHLHHSLAMHFEVAVDSQALKSIWTARTVTGGR